MNVAQNTASTQATSLVGAFTNGSIVKLYNGTIPATPETAIGSQTLLATITLPASAAFSQAAGVMTAAAITPGTVVATATAQFFRWLKSDGTTVIGDGYIAPTSGLSAYANSHAYTAGDQFTNGGNTYQVTTTGTSSATGTGPSLQVAGLKDGTMVCAYVDMLLAAVALGVGASVAPSAFTYTIPSV